MKTPLDYAKHAWALSFNYEAYVEFVLKEGQEIHYSKRLYEAFYQYMTELMVWEHQENLV